MYIYTEDLMISYISQARKEPDVYNFFKIQLLEVLADTIIKNVSCQYADLKTTIKRICIPNKSWECLVFESKNLEECPMFYIEQLYNLYQYKGSEAVVEFVTNTLLGIKTI